MSSEVRLGGKHRNTTLRDLPLEVPALVAVGWFLYLILADESTNRIQTVSAAVVVVPLLLFPLASLVRKFRKPRPRRDGVYLERSEIIIQNFGSESRIALAGATVSLSQLAIPSMDFIDGEGREWESTLSVSNDDRSIPVSLGMRSPTAARRYCDQLTADIADARWKLRLPEPDTKEKYS